MAAADTLAQLWFPLQPLASTTTTKTTDVSTLGSATQRLADALNEIQSDLADGVLNSQSVLGDASPATSAAELLQRQLENSTGATDALASIGISFQQGTSGLVSFDAEVLATGMAVHPAETAASVSKAVQAAESLATSLNETISESRGATVEMAVRGDEFLAVPLSTEDRVTTDVNSSVLNRTLLDSALAGELAPSPTSIAGINSTAALNAESVSVSTASSPIPAASDTAADIPSTTPTPEATIPAASSVATEPTTPTTSADMNAEGSPVTLDTTLPSTAVSQATASATAAAVAAYYLNSGFYAQGTMEMLAHWPVPRDQPLPVAGIQPVSRIRPVSLSYG
jgi:hypothetical protein